MAIKIKEVKVFNANMESGIEMKTDSEGCCFDAFPEQMLKAIIKHATTALKLAQKTKKDKATKLLKQRVLARRARADKKKATVKKKKPTLKLIAVVTKKKSTVEHQP